MLKNALYGGVNAAVLSPMRADLSIDLDRMAAHSRWLLDNGCNGLGILGTTGEANSIGIDERIEVMEGLVERGIPAARLLPGTGTPQSKLVRDTDRSRSTLPLRKPKTSLRRLSGSRKPGVSFNSIRKS